MMESANTAQHLIRDLGLVLASAASLAVICRALRLPALIGYVTAGILLRPLLQEGGGLSHQVIEACGEMGVLFLLFTIGLEFDLRSLGKLALPCGLALLLQTVGMLGLGARFGSWQGWSPMACLFLGGILCISSTMVSVRSLTEQGKRGTHSGRMALGIAILEDILAILLLVVLSGVGVSGQFQWGEAWQVSLLLGVFCVTVYFFGKIIAPGFVRFVHKHGSMELLTLFAAGFLMGVGLLAQRASFSLALGAFMAGAVLTHSRHAGRLEHSVAPLRDLFGAVFFTHIGLTLESESLLADAPAILVLGLLVVVGKVGACTLGLVLAGETPRDAFVASLAKANTSEFGFVIAALGLKLGVVDQRLFNFAVGVTLLTMLASPLLSARSDRLFDALGSRFPISVSRWFGHYLAFLSRLKGALSGVPILRLARRPLLQIVGYFCLFDGLLLSSFFLANNIISREWFEPHGLWVARSVWFLAGVASLPFAYAMVRNANAVILMLLETAQMGGGRLFKLAPVRHFFGHLSLGIVVLLLGLPYVGASFRFFPSGLAASALLILPLIAFAFVCRGGLIRFNNRLELLFVDSFSETSDDPHAKELEELKERFRQREGWNADLAEAPVPAQGEGAGRTIGELALRSRTGSTVAGLRRGGFLVWDAGPATRLYPGDILLLVGSPEQNSAAAALLAAPSATPAVSPATPAIAQVWLRPGSGWDGLTLAASGLHSKHGLTVLGVQRGEERFLGPGADFPLRSGDLLLVIGLPADIERFKTSQKKTSVPFPVRSARG